MRELHPDPAYTLALPESPRPIVVIGAGGIVRDAHLPAYAKAGFPVAALVDIDVERARTLADAHAIPAVYANTAEAVSDGVVYDIALPPAAVIPTLEALPDGAAVLLQKPLGRTLDEGRAIVEVCRRKGFTAAVNTQLRFAPYVAAARALIASGALGELYDVEARVAVTTPWEMFPYTLTMDRLEITMHSIHYLDLVRSFLGDPAGVSATSVRYPGKALSGTRSTVILHYPDRPVRAVVSTNHDHRFGSRHEESYLKWEGTLGAVRAQMGLLLDYPKGGPDACEYWLDDGEGWRPLPFTGSWFPDAFIGSMGALQRYLEGSVATLPTSVDDVLHTTALVEAAYAASDAGGVRPSYPGQEAR